MLDTFMWKMSQQCAKDAWCSNRDKMFSELLILLSSILSSSEITKGWRKRQRVGVKEVSSSYMRSHLLQLSLLLWCKSCPLNVMLIMNQQASLYVITKLFTYIKMRIDLFALVCNHIHVWGIVSMGTRIWTATVLLPSKITKRACKHVSIPTWNTHISLYYLCNPLSFVHINGRRLWCICSRLCCPFMLLPVPCVTSHTAFVFFKVPRKLAQRVKKFVKRRCGKTLQPRFKNGGGCRQRGAHWCGKGVVFEENVARDEHRVRFWKLLASWRFFWHSRCQIAEKKNRNENSSSLPVVLINHLDKELVDSNIFL